MMFCRFILLVNLVVIFCSSKMLANSSKDTENDLPFDNHRILAKSACNKYGIHVKYDLLVFKNKESENKFNECWKNLTDVSKRLGYNVSKKLFKYFLDYHFSKIPPKDSDKKNEEERKKWFSWLQRITKALEKSGWDNYMKIEFITFIENIPDDKTTQRLDVAEKALTFSTIEWWRKVLEYTFKRMHYTLHFIDQIMSNTYIKTFYDLYLEWWVDESFRNKFVSHGWFVDSRVIIMLSKLCSNRKEDYCKVKSKVFLLFDVLHSGRDLHIAHKWKLPSLEACLIKSSLAKEAPFETLLLVLGDAVASDAFRKVPDFKDDWELMPDDVWKLVLDCGKEGDWKLCVSSSLRAIAGTKAMYIQKLTFHNFIEKEVLGNGYDRNVGYSFLRLLYVYNFNQEEKTTREIQSEANQNTASHVINAVFKVQMTSQPDKPSLGPESLKIKAPLVEPMASLIGMVNSVWTVESLILFINTANECGLPSRDFAPFLYLIRKEFYQGKNNYNYQYDSGSQKAKMIKVKEIMLMSNSVNLQFNRKSLWLRLVERNKGLVLYDFVEVQNYIKKTGGGNNNELLYYFFRNRKMIKCSRDTIISVWVVIKKANVKYKESDYNYMIETSCEDEARRLAEEKRRREEAAAAKKLAEEVIRRLVEKKKKEEEDERRRRSDFHRRQAQTAALVAIL